MQGTPVDPWLASAVTTAIGIWPESLRSELDAGGPDCTGFTRGCGITKPGLRE